MNQKAIHYLLPEGESIANKNILFISYRHKDIHYLKPLIDLLHRTTNYAIWYDDNLQAGERYNDEIESILKRAVVMVQLITPSYFEPESYTMMKEVPFAIKTGIKIAAVYMDNTVLCDSVHGNKPDFCCVYNDPSSVDSFIGELNDYERLTLSNDPLHFCQKKINCTYITANEMFLLAQAFADGHFAQISKEEAIRYAYIADACEIFGSQELLRRLETM